MPMPPEKYPIGLAKAREDLLALLGMALEASVIILWFIGETLLRLICLHIRAVEKPFKRPPK